jgi:predicted ATP-dependent endonuclease of OLD family
MHLSRVRIVNFRNFAELVVPLAANVLMVGENRVGKSNFIFALRLVMDSSLPDSARELKLGDIWVDKAFERKMPSHITSHRQPSAARRGMNQESEQNLHA